MILIHDGTVNGFLTCVYYCYYEKLEPQAISSGSIQVSFVDPIKNIITETDKALRVKNAIIKEGGTFLDLEHAFSSYNTDKDLIIYHYIKQLFKYGQKVENMLNNSDIINFHSICYEVTRECQHLKGFLRFNETKSGVYYAQIEPDNNIVKFLMPHFTDRFSNQKFVIHDTKRNIVGIYDIVKSAVFQNNTKLNVDLSENEENIQNLFRTYHKTINITERKNKKLQLGWMPRRYHKHMPETFDKER